jgi:hypothetical protein
MRAARLAALAAGAAAMGTASRRSDAQASSAADPSERVVKDPRGGAVAFAPAPPPAAHPGARLAFVQVLTRHGDRTSINPLPFETREQWSALLLSDDEQSALAKEAAPFPADAGGLLDARAQALALADGEDASWHGQLTTRGVAQLAHTGSALRAWLVGADVAPSSRETAVQTAAVRIRSTGTRRTVQSAQALMRGMYPIESKPTWDDTNDTNDASSNPFPIEVRDRFRESMFPNPGMACARQTQLMRALDGDRCVQNAEARAWESEALRAVRMEVHERNGARRRASASQKQRRGKEKENKTAEMAEAVEAPAGAASLAAAAGEGESSAASVAEPSAFRNVTALGSNTTTPSVVSSRLPSATSVWEPLQARLNHGLPLPVGVTPDDVARIREAAEVRYVNRAANAEGAALAGGRLLRELAEESRDAIVALTNGGESPKLSVFSGHDSSILALLAVLGAFPGEWPPVASTVLVETWLVDRRDAGARAPGIGRPHWSERTVSSDSRIANGEFGDSAKRGSEEKQAMVRVLFNGTVLPLAGCAGQEDARKGGLCSLAAFRDMARRRDPEDYRKACEAVSARL